MRAYTASSERTVALQASEQAFYQTILNTITTDLNTFPPHLQKSAKKQFDALAASEFSPIVALLPYWLSDLLPLPTETLQQLGTAHLYGWWYYYVQDELLDGDEPAAALLSGHLALLRMVDHYHGLGLPDTPVWASFQSLNLTSSEYYTIELQTRFDHLADITPDQLRQWTIALVINRASPFYFNTLAQLQLAGIKPEALLHQDLLTALRYFGAVRQIGDDAVDWLLDLKQGRLNYVSARLIERFYAARHISGYDRTLDLEQLTGYQLTDEPFWAEIEATTQSLAQKALDALAPYGPCQLQKLIQFQLEKTNHQWQAARSSRDKLRQAFKLTPTA